MDGKLYATLYDRIRKSVPAMEFVDMFGRSHDVPPGIADVLRAMRETANTKHSVLEEDLLAKWNLSLDLAHQEDAVGEWLMTVIK